MDLDLIRRESSVIGHGLSEGLSDIVHTTWSDLGKAGSKFADSPLAATGEYLKNHWQDALAGAVISIVNPRGAASALLLGWSMRGFGTSTWQAMKEAADPNADLSKVKADFKEAVSHEGTAFLAAMPMAMAGAVAGRAGANAVFGRNKAAFDMLRGDVTAAEVKGNLLELRDSVRPPRVKTVITDLDGTTYAFHDYFAPAIRDAVPEIARKTGMSKAEVYKAMGEVMDARRTHDWPWVLEESEIARRWKGTPASFRTEVVEPYHAHVDAYMGKYLHAYPEVLETLAELKRRGIKVVALSDAPAFIAKTRATKTGVAQHLDALYALETPEPPVSAVGGIPQALEHGRKRVADLMAAPTPIPEVNVLPKHFEKPETGGILLVMGREPHQRPSHYLFTGDSRVKDGGVAHNVGIKYVRARYGSLVAPEYEEVLNTLRPNFGVAGPAKAKVYPPQIGESATYADILKFVEPRVDYMRLTKDLAGSLAVPPRLKGVLGFNFFPGQVESVER